MKHIVTATLLAVGATVAHADVELLTIETLMHAQANEVLALSLVSPSALNETLQYGYAVNTNDGSFSYQAVAGQTYNGFAYSISGAGTYDANTNTYTWSASGMLGSQTWAQTGQAPWIGDPTAAVTGNVSMNGNVVGTMSGNLEVVGGISSGTVTFTATGGSTRSYDVTDRMPALSEPWTLQYKDKPGKFVPITAVWLTSSQTGGIYQGTSTFTVAAVPEPETYAMMLAGLGLLGVVARRSKQKTLA